MDNDYFWKKKELFYFILSIMIVLCHSTGYSFYDQNNVLLSDMTRSIIELIWNKVNAWVGVAAFFLCSGFLFFDHYTWKNTLKKWKSRLQRLGVPYICWNIISLLWAIMIELLPFLRSNVTGSRSHFSFELLDALKAIFLYAYNPPMWYILQLMIFIFSAPIVWLLMKNKALGGIILLTTYIIYGNGISLFPFMITEQRQDVLFFWLLGAYLGLHFGDVIKSHARAKRPTAGFAIAVLIIFALFCGSLKPKYNWLDMPQIILFIILLWYSLDVLANEIKHLSWWGIHISFFIYMTHDFIEPCINKLIWIFLPHNDFWAIFNVCGGVIFTLLVIFVLAYIMQRNRFLNKLWHILNGNLNAAIIHRSDNGRSKEQ